MKKMLKKKSPKQELYHFVKSERIIGKTDGLYGDCTGLSGDCTALHGNCTGLFGNCTELFGDFNDCDITADERKNGIDIHDLINPTE